MPKNATIKNALLGTIITILLYIVPGINIAAPLIGGLAAGYSQRQGLRGGLKVGVLIAFFMFLPGLVISTLLMQIPDIGLFLGLGWTTLSVLIIGHSALTAVIGGMIGGAFSDQADR